MNIYIYTLSYTYVKKVLLSVRIRLISSLGVDPFGRGCGLFSGYNLV